LYEHLLSAPQSAQERFERVRFCERLQHGRGSAIDASAVVFGGLNRVADGMVQQIPLPPDHTLRDGQGWYWMHTGVPETKTGECVAFVRQHHGQDRALWGDFAACTQAFETCLQDGRGLQAVIRENHVLLRKIGVVSKRAEALVASVEALGGAAKVSGAGAVAGDAGGVVLIYLDDPEAVAAVQADYPDFRCEPLKIALQGAALCGDQP